MTALQGIKLSTKASGNTTTPGDSLAIFLQTNQAPPGGDSRTMYVWVLDQNTYIHEKCRDVLGRAPYFLPCIH